MGDVLTVELPLIAHPVDRLAHGGRAGPMPLDTGQVPLPGPPAVSVHYYTEVPRQNGKLRRIGIFFIEYRHNITAFHQNRKAKALLRKQ